MNARSSRWAALLLGVTITAIGQPVSENDMAHAKAGVVLAEHVLTVGALNRDASIGDWQGVI
jgi:hypothetical protein